MVVDAPNFDPELEGHAAVTLDRESEEIVHALKTEYPDGDPELRTECGMPVENDDSQPRGEFSDSSVIHCDDCWPSHIPDSAGSEGEMNVDFPVNTATRMGLLAFFREVESIDDNYKVNLCPDRLEDCHERIYDSLDDIQSVQLTVTFDE